jgi:hypothetical protein
MKKHTHVSQPKKNLVEHLHTLEDHRRKQGQRHPLHVVALVVIMGIMSGAKSERAVTRFAKNNKEVLIKTLQLTRNEVPSKSVIGSFVQHMDFKKLEELFHLWTMQFVHIEKGEWINIDGKAIRGTFKGQENTLQDFISLVTIFQHKKKQVLTVGKLNAKKENEIPTVRELIEMLNIQGVTFTLDALHCQSKTLKAIIRSKNDYLVGVKNNQKKLSAQLKKTVKTATVSVPTRRVK